MRRPDVRRGVRESFRTTSERSEEAQERANRLTRSFFESVTSELQAEARRNQAASQQLAEQSKRQQEAFRRMTEESMALYRDFLGSVSAYYQANMERAQSNVQSGARTATQATERAASSVQNATERTATSVQAAAEEHPGVPIEDYDELNVGQVASLFGRVSSDGHGGGVVEAEIPRSELDYYASRLLSVGTDLVVESPPEFVKAVREKAREVARLYA